MTGQPAPAPVGDAQRAFERGMALLGEERYSETAAEWQNAFRSWRDGGELRLAARTAIELARLFGGDPGTVPVARGWVERARSLLERVGPCVESGYLELAVMACDRNDAVELLESAERALQCALEYGDSTLEALAQADGGLALVTAGSTRDGFARLEAALAAVTAGEVEGKAAGICFCSMLTACDRAGEAARAEQWVTIVEAWLARLPSPLRVMSIHCRMAYGSVLCSVGRWVEGEALLREALGTPEAPAIAHRALTVAHLAGLRIDQGRVDEAAELLAGFDEWVTSCLPLARVHLARGDFDVAAAVARRGLSELRGDALRAAPLLAALVRIELARGDDDAARRAADELDQLASGVDLPALHADAALAAGRIAVRSGDHAGAQAAFERAKSQLPAGERPFALGLVRVELARVLDAAGDRAAAVAEARAALAAFDRVGAALARDEVGALLRSWGETVVVSRRAGAAQLGGLTKRELEVLGLVAAGLTNAEIGARLFISAKTVEHHVGRVLAKLGVRSRAEAAALSVRLAAAK